MRVQMPRVRRRSAAFMFFNLKQRDEKDAWRELPPRQQRWMEGGADVSVQAIGGHTALSVAQQMGKFDVVKLLSGRGMSGAINKGEGEDNALAGLLEGPALLGLTVAVGAIGLGVMWWLKKRGKR